MTKDFATNLIYLRGERNLTQQQLGDAVGVSPSQISRYEAGQAMPRKTVMRKLADALGVPLEKLAKPEMTVIVIDEPEQELWKVSLPKQLIATVQEHADAHGTSLEAMFLAELERAKHYYETGEDQGIEHHLREAEEFLQYARKTNEKKPT